MWCSSHPLKEVGFRTQYFDEIVEYFDRMRLLAGDTGTPWHCRPEDLTKRMFSLSKRAVTVSSRKDSINQIELDGGEYVIRTPKSFKELAWDMVSLRYFGGVENDLIKPENTPIIFIRKKNDPDTPFATAILESSGAVFTTGDKAACRLIEKNRDISIELFYALTETEG